MWVLDNALVTGGSGFLGSHLVDRLVSMGVKVKALDNNWRGTPRNLIDVADKIEFIEADIRDYPKIEQAAKEVDIIFNLASIQGTKFFYIHPDLVTEVGILGNLNIARAAIKENVSKVVFTSSSEVYADPDVIPTPEDHPLIIPDTRNPRWAYSMQKIFGESIFLMHEKDFDSVIIRIFNTYGPRMGWNHVISEFITRLELGEKFTIEGTGDETRSFCYVDDAIDGIILASTKDEGRNEVFNIGHPEEMHIIDLISHLEEISGKKIDPTFVDRPDGSPIRRSPDITKAKKLLGFSPKVGIRKGLEKTYDWYKREINWCKENEKQGQYSWLK